MALDGGELEKTDEKAIGNGHVSLHGEQVRHCVLHTVAGMRLDVDH